MANLVTLARDVTIAVNTGTVGVPVWTTVGGLTQHTWANGKEDADTTTYDSDGWEEHIVAARSRGVTLAGKRKESTAPASATQDPGQLAVEAANELMADASLIGYKVTFVSGKTLIGNASVSVNPSGGGNNDPNSWEATLKFSGHPVIA